MNSMKTYQIKFLMQLAYCLGYMHGKLGRKPKIEGR